MAGQEEEEVVPTLRWQQLVEPVEVRPSRRQYSKVEAGLLVSLPSEMHDQPLVVTISSTTMQCCALKSLNSQIRQDSS